MPYSYFIDLVRQGDIKAVTISGRTIEGVEASGEQFSSFAPDDEVWWANCSRTMCHQCPAPREAGSC